VLVVHAWWGLNDFVKRVCNRLDKEGFVVLAPDLFEGHVATTIADAKRWRAKPKREPTYKTLIRAIDRHSWVTSSTGPTCVCSRLAKYGQIESHPGGQRLKRGVVPILAFVPLIRVEFDLKQNETTETLQRHC
jgi:Dienelactone hydrolase family